MMVSKNNSSTASKILGAVLFSDYLYAHYSQKDDALKIKILIRFPNKPNLNFLDSNNFVGLLLHYTLIKNTKKCESLI